MKRSLLLQLARDSIVEVFQAQNSIDKKELLEQHQLLHSKIPTTLNIYLKQELRGSYAILTQESSLLENVIICAKKAAFEDEHFSPLTTSEYLSCEIELILETDEGIMSEKDPAILKD
jgi:AMMECR1 domain-containing protein